MSDHERPDEPYTHDVGLKKMLEAVVHGSVYPQGEPFPVTVTLSDEHWSAVNTVISMMIIAQHTEGNRMLPDFMLNQIHEAFHAIRDACIDVTGAQTIDKLIEEIQTND